MSNNSKLLVFTLILIGLTTACKFYLGPDLDWSGFSPVFAIALFAGFIFRQKGSSFLLPLLALFISDVIIHLLYKQGLFPYAGFYDGQWKNYLVLLSATVIGWLLKGRSFTTILAGAIAAPTAFFLLSNFSVWLGSDGVYYTKDFSGLMTCYAAGLPFYKNALIATIIFLPAILITYNAFSRKKAVLTVA